MALGGRSPKLGARSSSTGRAICTWRRELANNNRKIRLKSFRVEMMANGEISNTRLGPEESSRLRESSASLPKSSPSPRPLSKASAAVSSVSSSSTRARFSLLIPRML